MNTDYHATCQGVCNRYEFAQEVLKLAGKRITLRPVVTSESDLSSARPAYAVLDNFILRIINVYEMPDWRASLEKYMDEMRTNMGETQKKEKKKIGLTTKIFIALLTQERYLELFYVMRFQVDISKQRCY